MQIEDDQTFIGKQFSFASDPKMLLQLTRLIEVSNVLAQRHRTNSELRRTYLDVADELIHMSRAITIKEYWSLVEHRMLKLIVQEEQNKVARVRFVA